MNTIPGVLVIPKFLSPTVCKKLKAIYDKHRGIAGQRDYGGNPALWLFDLSAHKAPEEYEFMCAQVVKSRDVVRAKMGIDEPLLIEAAFLTALPPGGSHMLHCDNCTLDGAPNHTPQRDYSSIVYLNDEFEGGELVFPSRGILKPKTGMLVAFPAGRDFPHQVKHVKTGKRYSLPVWYTLKPQYNMFGSHR